MFVTQFLLQKYFPITYCRSLHRCLTTQQVEQIVNIAITIVNITIVNITINIVNMSIIFAENRWSSCDVGLSLSIQMRQGMWIYFG